MNFKTFVSVLYFWHQKFQLFLTVVSITNILSLNHYYIVHHIIFHCWMNIFHKYCFASFQTTITPHNAQSFSTSKGSLFCEQCNKSFVSMLGYQKHMKAHQGIYRYKCETCNKGFNCTTNYKEHLAMHTGVNYFRCEKCGESFRIYRQLQKHKSSCYGGINK